MKIKCFIFTNYDNNDEITSKINNWLSQHADKHIHDIKVSMGGNGSISIHTNYTIMYDDQPKVQKELT